MLWFPYSSVAPIEFEFDETKSQSNLAKHAIDFVEAQRIWDDENKTIVAGRSTDEERWIIVGKIDDKLYSAIFTWRDRRVRIISVRRSHEKEVKQYERSNR